MRLDRRFIHIHFVFSSNTLLPILISVLLLSFLFQPKELLNYCLKPIKQYHHVTEMLHRMETVLNSAENLQITSSESLG